MLIYHQKILQFPRINKVYDNTTPSWKVMPLHLIETKPGLNSEFLSNLDISV